MTFAPIEESRQRGMPAEVFLFEYGTEAGSFYAYTDAEQSVQLDDVTYLPVPISRAALASTGTLDKSLLEIRIPHTAGLAELFRVYPPTQVVSCVIKQGHLNDPDSEFLTIWTGRVIGCKRDGPEAVLQAEPISTSMRRVGLRRHMQFGCPHVLYGPQCRADKAAATVTRTVVSIGDQRIVLSDGWHGAKQPEDYVGGLVEWDGTTGREFRTILKATATTLKLTGIVRDLAAGDSVDVVLGCRHDMDDCKDLHNNRPNFGGCPWIPTENPVGKNTYW